MGMRKIVQASIFTSACFALGACHSIGDVVDAVQKSRVNTYSITVADASGKPIPYATVWYVQRYPSHPELTPDMMSTLLQHYSVDADYIGRGEIQGELQIAYTDADGHAEMTADGWTDEVKGSAESFVTIAALKRGYRPAMVADQARYVTHRDVTLHLDPDPSVTVEPQLLGLDRARYDAEHSAQHGEMAEGREQVLALLQSDLRDAAAALEAAGKPDAAARIYYYLSEMPGVFAYGPGGQVMRGYTNRFDENDPQRVSDREKALELNTSVPMMLYTKAVEKFFVKDKDVYHDINYGSGETPRRAEYLSIGEGFQQKYGDRLWPVFFTAMADKYARQGKYPEACRELNRAYGLLPGFVNTRDWWHELEMMQYYEDGKLAPITVCTVAGLPPQPVA